jgi:hypothetical protein
MLVLRRGESTGEMKVKTIPSFPAPPGRGRRSVRKAQPQAERVWGAGLKKFEAEDLLDWLEANGRAGNLSYVAGKGFSVR